MSDNRVVAKRVVRYVKLQIDSQQGYIISVKLTKCNLTAACVNINCHFKECSGDLGFLECLCQIDLLNLDRN